MIYVKFIVLFPTKNEGLFICVQSDEKQCKILYFKTTLDNFFLCRATACTASHTKTQAKMSGISPENPTGFFYTHKVTSLSIC